jgi:hypothetical protein
MDNYSATLRHGLRNPKARAQDFSRNSRDLCTLTNSYTPFKSEERAQSRARSGRQSAARRARQRARQAEAKAARAAEPKNPQCDLLISRSHCNATRYKRAVPVVVPND